MAVLLEHTENSGISANHAAVSCTMAATFGCIAALVASAVQSGSKGELAWDLPSCMNGALSGLVACTSGCFVMSFWSAALTGLVGGFVYIASDRFLIRNRIDDTINVIPVHFSNGIWGLIATGLLADPALVKYSYGIEGHGGFFYEIAGSAGSDAGSLDNKLLRNQLYAVIFIIIWTSITFIPFYFLLSYMNWFRVEELAEVGGLDAAYHDEELEDSAKEEIKHMIDVKHQRDKNNKKINKRDPSLPYSSQSPSSAESYDHGKNRLNNLNDRVPAHLECHPEEDIESNSMNRPWKH